MRADDFLDGASSADNFLDGGAAPSRKAKPDPSLKDRVYSALNGLFREQSVMENYAGQTGQQFDPVATAKIDRQIAQPTVRALPDAAPAVGIIEKGVRGGVSQLAKSGLGLAQMAGDALDLPAVSEIAAGANRRATKFGSNPLQAGRIDGFTQDSIVQDLPGATSGAISSIISNAPSLAANVVLPGSGLPLMGAQVTAGEYGDGRESGLSPVGALLRALPMAGAEVLGEKFGGFNPLTKGIRQSIDEGSLVPLGRAMLASSAREVPSEQATTLMQFGIDKLPGIGANQDATAADLTKQLKDTALQTIMQSGGMAGIGGAISGSQPQAAPPQAIEAPTLPADVGDLSDLIASTASIASRNDVPANRSADDFLDADPLDAIGTTPQAQQQTDTDMASRAEVAPAAQPQGASNNAQNSALSPDVQGQPAAVDTAAGTVPVAVPDAAVTVQPEPVAQEVSQTEVAGTGSMPARIEGDATASVPVDLPAPARLDGERAMQVAEPQAGMRPGDIVATSGAPFKDKNLAAVVKRQAGPGWALRKSGGGWVVRHAPPSDKQVANGKRQAAEAGKVDASRDSMFAAITKLGGISRAEVVGKWGHKDAGSLRVGIKPVLRAKGGMTLERAAEALAELGYLNYDENGKHDLRQFEELFSEELGGSKHFTPEGYATVGQQQQEQEWLSQQDAAALDRLPDDLQDATEGLIDDYETSTEADETDLGASLDRATGEDRGNTSAEEGSNRVADQAAEEAPPAPDADQRAGDAGQDAAGVRSESVDDFGLQGETAAEAQARIDRQNQQTKDEQRSRQEADRRAQVDAERDSFTLTGSDRSADVAAAQGQGDIFSSEQQDADIPFDADDARLQPTDDTDDVPFSRGTDIPAPYWNRVKVQHQVWVTDESRFDTAEVTAQEAIDSVREDIDNYKRLLDCMKGGA